MRRGLWKPGVRTARVRDVQCVWPVEAELGEGPFWSAAENALWFVDIASNRIHRFDHALGMGRSWPAPGKVSFILPRMGKDFIIGLPGSLALFEPGSGSVKIIATVEEDKPRNRLNDACVDARGRLWFGTMDVDEREATGALYRWDGQARPSLQDSGYIISNGPAFSPDGRYFYMTNTLARTIYRFEVTEDGQLRGKSAFIVLGPDMGFPDGTTVDAEGCLWIALYGGWAVQRYSPEGKYLEAVRIPCANVTKLAFGGSGMTTAFVTTARQGLRPQDILEQPLAGGLFRFETQVPGLATASIL